MLKMTLFIRINNMLCFVLMKSFISEPFMCSDPVYKELEKKLICDTFLFKVLNKSNIQVPSKFMCRNSPQKLWPTPSSNSNNCGHSAAHYLSMF